MKPGLDRWRRSKAGRVLAVVAVLSFVVLFRPYCELVDTAGAGTLAQQGHGVGHGHGDRHNEPQTGDNCPSLEHTPLALLDTVPLVVPNVSPQFVAAQGTDRNASALGRGRWIAPLATPPPVQSLPIYLRYAHLLI